MPARIEQRTYRLVTSLSYDLVNSTDQMQQLGIEAFALMLEKIHLSFRQAIVAHGGWAHMAPGDDGCMCFFGARQVLQQAKDEALRTALALQHLAAQQHWPVRIGLAYGQVAVLGEQLIGPSINLAARLQKLAQPGQVLVSPELAAQTSDAFSYQVLPLQTIKGFKEPIQALQLLALRPSRSHGASGMPDLPGAWAAQAAAPTNEQTSAATNPQAAAPGGANGAHAQSTLTTLMPLTPLQAVPHAATQAGAGLHHLHGRQLLLKNLRKLWAQAQTGESVFCQLQGDAGMGKTALVQSLVQSLLQTQAQTQVQTLAQVQAWPKPLPERLAGQCEFWHCSPDRQHSAYHPVIGALMRWAQMTASDELAMRQDKLQQALSPSPLSPPQCWALFALLDLPPPEACTQAPEDPQAYETRLAQGVAAWLRWQSQGKALLLVIEDLHWIDSATLRLLGRLRQALQGQAALVLSTTRPHTALQAAQTPWGDEGAVQVIELHSLDFEESSALIRDLSGGQPWPPEVVEWVVERAAGIPLFIHETVRTLQRAPHGEAVAHMAASLQAHPSGHKASPGSTAQKRAQGGWLTASYANHTMGDSTREILMERMDALGDKRWLAQLSSVLGTEFSLEMLLHLTQACGYDAQGMDVLAQVDALVDNSFFKRDTSGPQILYRHAHALLREVAYQTLWVTDRQKIHASILAIYEQHYPQFVQEQPSTIAQHWLGAGQIDKAVGYLLKAAQASKRKGAHSVSIDCAQQALDLLQGLPAHPEVQQQQLQVALLVAGQIMATEGYGTHKAGAHYRLALQLAQTLHDDKAQLKALLGLHAYHLLRGEFDMAEQLVHQGQHLSHTAHDPLTHLLWRFAQAMLAFYRGQMQSCVDLMRECEALCAQVPQSEQLIQSPKIMSVMYSAFCLWALGQTEEALREGQRGLQLAQQHPYRLAKVQAKGILAMLLFCRGDFVRAHTVAGTGVQVAEQGEYALWSALPRFIEAAAQCELAAHGGGGKQAHTQAQTPTQSQVQGLRQMLAAHQQWARSDSVLTQPFFLTTLAQCHMAAGELQSAQQQLDLAHALVTQHGERYYASEVQRTQAMLWLQKLDTSRPATSVRHIQHLLENAYTDAQARGAHSLALRVALSMHACEQHSPLLGNWWGQHHAALHWVAQSLQALAPDSSTLDAQQARQWLQRRQAAQASPQASAAQTAQQAQTQA